MRSAHSSSGRASASARRAGGGRRRLPGRSRSGAAAAPRRARFAGAARRAPQARPARSCRRRARCRRSRLGGCAHGMPGSAPAPASAPASADRPSARAVPARAPSATRSSSTPTRSRTRTPRSSSRLRSGKPRAGACCECGDNHRTVPRRLALLAAVASLAGCGGTGDVHMTAVPREALVDAPLRVHADGLHGRATLTLTITDADGRKWTTRRPFREGDATPLLASILPPNFRGDPKLVPFLLPFTREDRARAQQGRTHRCDDHRDSARWSDPDVRVRPQTLAGPGFIGVFCSTPGRAWRRPFSCSAARRAGSPAGSCAGCSPRTATRRSRSRTSGFRVCRRRSAASGSNTSRALCAGSGSSRESIPRRSSSWARRAAARLL